MDIALTLLQDVRWRGTVVVGDRPRALLAALVRGDGRSVPDERLVDFIWGDEVPANASNSLQVLVSRTRTACGPGSIVRDGPGYRLGISPAQIDCVRLSELVRDAAAALDGDATRAGTLAREAVDLAADLAAPGEEEDLLTRIRRAAGADVATAHAVLAQASSRAGAHAEALPGLESAHARQPDDETLLADLLRSEAAVRGPAPALERYDRHRRDLRDRLGVGPGERLQRMHRELLARDTPVRTGVHFDATSLVGRDRDITRLRARIEASRVVSIVGPGGLGKTRLAHVLAREAAQPVVHFVELVGVTATEDVVGEVGSALGVRDSVSSRRALTPQQQADIRGRIAQRLGQAPSLLVLDNCEHVIDAVAGLVAALIATCADLRVLTTSRAPLAIGAEHVYLLGELDLADATRLFCERASAARAGVRLDEEIVHSIVARLDGLPLAIELAAAKARAMAVEEIDRRLENRFALLRGGDRSAPDRHQTLLAVIDWSWNLLDPTQQRALRRLALFNDGFTLPAADAVLGDGALEPVQGLVDQSLLSLHDTASGVRYRMLETVREFGRMHLIDAGEDAEARAARRRWAVDYAHRYGEVLMSPEQFAAIDAIGAEEINLSDELRECLAERDLAALVELLASVGVFWAIRGDHGRLISVAGGVADAVEDWTPPPELADPARAAMAITLTNAMITHDERSNTIREALSRIGPGHASPLSGMVRAMLECDPLKESFAADLQRLAEDPDPDVAWTACQWLSNVRENSGDPRAAVAAAERALQLVGEKHGPWAAAILNNQLAQLTMHLGDRRRAAEYANASLPVMHRLRATDDEVQLRSLLALGAIADGDQAAAEEQLDLIDAADETQVFGSIAIGRMGRAELALARGEYAAGLRGHRECAKKMQELRWPGLSTTGLEPWVLFGQSTALAAHAFHATGADAAHGWDLFLDCRERALQLDPDTPHLDFPVAGLALFGLGAWCLLRIPDSLDAAAHLLALADRFAYNRTIPTMAWERIAPLVEERAPGLLAQLQPRYRERRPKELLDEAHALIKQLPRTSEVPFVTADGQRREDRDHREAGQ